MIDLQVVERYVDTITSLALEKVREQLLHVFYLASLPARDAKELVDKWEAKMLTLERESRALGSRIIAGNLSKLKAHIACVERYEDFTWVSRQDAVLLRGCALTIREGSERARSLTRISSFPRQSPIHTLCHPK